MEYETSWILIANNVFLNIFWDAFIHSTIDTNDYTSRSGRVTISEDALIQCVSIPIRSDGFSERQQCFYFGITATQSVSGLTVSPGQAEICIMDINSKWKAYHAIHKLMKSTEVQTLAICNLHKTPMCVEILNTTQCSYTHWWYQFSID